MLLGPLASQLFYPSVSGAAAISGLPSFPPVATHLATQLMSRRLFEGATCQRHRTNLNSHSHQIFQHDGIEHSSLLADECFSRIKLTVLEYKKPAMKIVHTLLFFPLSKPQRSSNDFDCVYPHGNKTWPSNIVATLRCRAYSV
jgi:hypothetical protein